MGHTAFATFCLLTFLLGNFWFNIVAFQFLWTWMLPPFSPGFILFLVYLATAVDDMNEFMFPLITAYFSGLYLSGFRATYIFCNPALCAGLLVGYIIFGIVWSFIKLNLFLGEERVQESMRRIGVEYNTHTTRSGDNQYPNSKTPQERAAIFLQNNKYRMYSWIVYWPFSIINTFVFNFVQNVLNYLFNNFLKQLYLRVISRAFEKLN